MSRKFFALLGASVLFFGFAAACDDDETTGTGGSGNTGNTTNGGGGAGNTGGDMGGGSAECVVAGEPTADNCADACELLFCCAEPRCDGLTAPDEDQFRAGCEQTCAGMMATIAVVNGANCDQTIATVKGVSPTFTDTCDNGLSQGGGGAGGN